jgi:hypothetical protein
VEEFWVCHHCRSLNRAGTGRCYHCKEKLGSKPKDAPPPVRPAAPPPTPIGQAGQGIAAPAGFGAPIGSTPPGEPPAYMSRPVALAPTPVRDFSGPRSVEAAKPPRSRPQLTGWIRRRIAWSLATRPFVPIRFIGYAAAVLVTLVLLTGALIVSTVAPVARTALQSGSLTAAWNQIEPGHRWTLVVILGIFVGIGALALLFFSLLVGLSTHNAPGLGAQTPYLSPARAGTAWLRALMTQLRLGVGLIVPAVLIWRGYSLIGLIAAFIAVELAQHNSDDPFAWLSNPARHLPDLFAKLGVSGSSSSFLGSAWAFCFRAANTLAIVAYTLPLLTIGAFAIATVSGHSDALAWQTSGYGPIQLIVAAVVVLVFLTTSGAIGLLVPVSIELVERQKTRQTLVRVGRSRPWVARPGNISAPALDDGPTRYDPYELGKVVDQASLNSPSTTSSFPWEVPSDESSAD